jgi:nitrate reductase NapE component
VVTHASHGVSRERQLQSVRFSVLTVGLESVAMFGSFGLFAVWCYTVKKSHLALQRECRVLLLGFLMGFISHNLNQ